jgi:16S rRNA (guanine966-N2)-methyltransferase
VRIISGTARGKRLASFAGGTIRPTPDRVREALFSILLSRLGTLCGKRVLDLFAGTGAMALEALSRGADRAVLVEHDPGAARLIASNLQNCAFQDRAKLIRSEVLAALPRLPGAPFDLIFLDPPYHMNYPEKTISAVSSLDLLAPGGILCAETAAEEKLPERIGSLVCGDSRRYGSTAVHLFTHASEAPGL